MTYQKHRQIRAELTRNLVRDEGLRLEPYRCTAGALTIGVGRNLDGNGISKDEAMYLLDNDIESVFDCLDRNVPWWVGLPEGAKLALANMCFNLGWPRLARFQKMLAAMKSKDFETAADEALDSRWARQVGDRSQRISKLIRSEANA